MKTQSAMSMGSKDWADAIFASPTSRTIKGHSRPTQYHQCYVPSAGQMMGVQGRTEAVALIALEYMHTLGLVRRFKSQPFMTDKQEFGEEVYPDFLVELSNDSFCLVEVKTERFLNTAVQRKLDRLADGFSRFEMEYLVWTDKRPLIHPTRHHLIQIRRNAVQGDPTGDIASLVALVTSSNGEVVSFDKVRTAGHSIDTVYAAVGQGKLFIRLGAPFSKESRLSTWRQENYQDIFLECKRSANEWWESL